MSLLPVEPRVPEEPVPLYLPGIIELQQKTRHWMRLATLASVLTAFAFLALALYGRLPWGYAVPFFLAPFLPIAAETRLAEIKQVIDRQLLDRMRDTDETQDAASGDAPREER